MLNEEIAEREKFISENRISSHNTFMRSVGTTTIGNPLLTSYSVNSYFVGSKEKLRMAFNTGIYEQYTFMGGSLFGNKYAKIFKASPGAKKVFGDKFTMNYINDVYTTTNKGFKQKINTELEMIEKGVGISRNYSDLFTHLKNLGFEELKIYKNGELFTGGREEVVKKLNKFFANLSPEDLATVQANFKKAGIKIGNFNIVDVFTQSGKALKANESLNIANSFYDRFLTKSLGETVMSNGYIRAALGTSSTMMGNVLNGVGAFLGIMSVTHQDVASQSVVNANNFSHIKGENTLNERADQSVGATYQSSQYNAMDYNYILNSRNTAEGLRRNIDDIDIDTTKAKAENFTIY